MKRVYWGEIFNEVDHGKRLIEFVALCLEPVNGFVSYKDIADILGVDEVTIKRYRKRLNCIGISIHSYKSKGVVLDRELISTETIGKLIRLYQAYITIVNTVLFDEETPSTINKLEVNGTMHSNERVLSNLVMIQLAIERNDKLQIEYEQEGKIENHFISPVRLDSDELKWHLKAHNMFKLELFQGDCIKSLKRK